MEQVLTVLKIVVIGESGVGKSSLLLRFIDEDFNPQQPVTVGIDFKLKYFRVNDNTVKLSIWDTAGQEKFRSVTPAFFRDAHGAILVYDISNQITFRKIEKWLNDLEINSNQPNIVKMIVGNKIDLARQVSKEEGMKLAKRHASLFIETSARNNDGVQSAFNELVAKILETPQLWDCNDSYKLRLENSEKEVGSVSKCVSKCNFF